MTARRAILEVLNNVWPRLMTEVAVQVDLSAMVSERVTVSELRGVLQELETFGKVASVRDEEHRVRWRITDLGRIELV